MVADDKNERKSTENHREARGRPAGILFGLSSLLLLEELELLILPTGVQLRVAHVSD